MPNDNTGSGSNKRALQARELTTYSQYVRPIGNTIPDGPNGSRAIKYCYSYKALKDAVVVFIPPKEMVNNVLYLSKYQNTIKASSDYKTICKDRKPSERPYGAPGVHLESGGPVRISSIAVYY